MTSETHKGFDIGDYVIDVTAEENGWQDVNGTIIDIDGPNIKIRYTSGAQRWKLYINIAHDTARYVIERRQGRREKA